MKPMRLFGRWISLSIVICILLSCPALADTFDLSGMSYDELVALKETINLAIWNSAEWEDVEIPQGVYKVGEDIPAGHWTVKCADGWRYTNISWGEHLSKSGESIEWKGRFSNLNYVYNPNHKFFEKGDGTTEYSFEIRAGEYIIIDKGSAVFMPYSGKQSFGFKKALDSPTSKNAPAVSQETTEEKGIQGIVDTILFGFKKTLDNPTSKNVPAVSQKTTKEKDIQGIVDTILSYKNDETDKAWQLIEENASKMNKKQLESCLVSYGKWESVDVAIKEIKSHLKSPRSFYLYDGSVGIAVKENDTQYSNSVTIKYGATNGFGAEVTDTVEVNVLYTIDTNTVSVTFDEAKLSAYDAWRLR